MKIYYFEELDSTNTYLKEHLDLPSGTVVVAAVQTAGKGRLGRHWVAPKGNLSASLLTHQPKGDFALYPLLCALAAAELVETQTGCTVGIKWPNDLVLAGKKICGILCESVIGAQVSVICGIGINVNSTADELGGAALPYATSLNLATGRKYDTKELAGALMLGLLALIARFEEEGFAPLLVAYQQRLVSYQKEVQVLYEGRTVRARCLGIAENGNLLCENDAGRFTVHSGEASVRGLYGYV